MSQFRYFPGFPAGAPLKETACTWCGRTPSIPAVYLAPVGAAREPICAECLGQGRGQVKVPDWVQRELARAVTSAHPTWSLSEREVLIAARLEALAHTPPVPWLQNNEWPVCGDDFAVFAGELTRERWVQRWGSEAEGKRALRDVLLQTVPEWSQDEADVDAEWSALANDLAIFEFHCAAGETLYVVQLA
jgi:hypothetical protein